VPKKTRGQLLREAIESEMRELNCRPTSVEEELLSIAVGMADRIERLEAIAAKEGEIVTTPTGTTKTNPAVTESRAQAVALARVLSSISITDSTGEASGKNQQKQRAARRRWNLEAARA
jgi:hypothetical protein